MGIYLVQLLCGWWSHRLGLDDNMRKQIKDTIVAMSAGFVLSGAVSAFALYNNPIIGTMHIIFGVALAWVRFGKDE
jgi:di/tricarboxylate transporter